MTDRPWLRHYDPEVPASLEYPPGDLYGQFAAAAERCGERTALEFLGRATSYRALHGQVRALAGALHARGVGRGDRVLLLLPNCPQFVVAYFALQYLGAVAVLANPLNAPRELAFKVRDSGAMGAVVLDLLAAKLAPVRAEGRLAFELVTSVGAALPAPKRWLYPLARRLDRNLPRVELPRGPGCARLERLLGEGLEPPPRQAPDPEDPAVLIYTGGTTGVSKGIVLSHRALVANLTQARAWVGMGNQDALLAVLPLFHGFGMSVCMNAPLAGGGRVVLLPRFDPARVVATIERRRPTLFAGVPSMFIALEALPDLARRDLTSLRGIFVGAAPLPLEVLRRFEQLTGAPLIEGYGLTEAVTAIACNPVRGTRKPGTVGIPFPDVEWRVVDLEDGTRELPPGEPGEVVLRGPDLMTGYWNRPADTAAALRDGWLHTGDVGVLDEDGYLTIVDRLKDLVIVNGFNVFPSEIDEVLHRHPAVREAVALGLPHPRKGEFIKAYVVPREGAALTPEDVQAYCRQHLSAYMVPGEVELRSELPKSAVGKVLRRQLREEQVNGEQ